MTAVGSALRTAKIGALIANEALRLRCGRGLNTSDGVRRVVEAAGVSAVIDRRSDDGPRLVCANHLGYIEIPVLLAEMDVAVVAEAKLESWPVLGTLMANAGTIFVDRLKPSSTVAMVDAISERLHAGQSVLCFPEGTPSASPAPAPFRTGVFEAAIRTNTPVLPVGIRIETVAGLPVSAESREIVSWHRDSDGRRPHIARHLAGLCDAAPTSLRIRFGRSIAPGDNRKVLACEVHSSVSDLCAYDAKT